jgi:hypothetical protein
MPRGNTKHLNRGYLHQRRREGRVQRLARRLLIARGVITTVDLAEHAWPRGKMHWHWKNAIRARHLDRPPGTCRNSTPLNPRRWARLSNISNHPGAVTGVSHQRAGLTRVPCSVYFDLDPQLAQLTHKLLCRHLLKLARRSPLPPLEPTTSRRASCYRQSILLEPGGLPHRLVARYALTCGLLAARDCRGRGPDELRIKHCRAVWQGGRLCGQNSQRCQTRRSANSATDQV